MIYGTSPLKWSSQNERWDDDNDVIQPKKPNLVVSVSTESAQTNMAAGKGESLTTVSTESNGGGNNSLVDDLGMYGVSLSLDDGIETSVRISGVLDDTDGAVGFSQGVLSLDDISMTNFRLFLLVTGMVIRYSILELVLSRCLTIAIILCKLFITCNIVVYIYILFVVYVCLLMNIQQ